jgi:hypothetical protein
MYLLVYVRLLQSIDILTQIVIPTEARDLAVGTAREHVYACEEQGGAIKFARCNRNCLLLARACSKLEARSSQLECNE